MKWRQFILIWLIIFLLAPSIWIHRILMFQTPPPGSNLPPPPLLIPFVGVYWGRELWGQLIRGDFVDSLVIFLVLILPILIYTFLISCIIYYSFRSGELVSEALTSENPIESYSQLIEKEITNEFKKWSALYRIFLPMPPRIRAYFFMLGLSLLNKFKI